MAPSGPAYETFDQDIQEMKAKLDALKRDLNMMTNPSHSLFRTAMTKEKQLFLDHIAEREAHRVRQIHRVGAGITSFTVLDPDPNAVDKGKILGFRIEIVFRAKFLRPYFVLLNRPYPGEDGHFRVHRHTLPAGVPLDRLALKYLPPPSMQGKKQNITEFMRSVRREAAQYHARGGAIADMINAAGLGKKKHGEEQPTQEGQLIAITAADAATKQVSFQWADGRSTRLVMSDNGKILTTMMVGKDGKKDDERMFRNVATVEDLVKWLASNKSTPEA